MLGVGAYADGRNYVVPSTWARLAPGELRHATQWALDALTRDQETLLESVVEGYDPQRGRPATLALDLEPVPTDHVGPADLLAAHVAGAPVPPSAVRTLTQAGGGLARAVRRDLEAIPLGLPITSLDEADPLVRRGVARMWDLDHHLRSAASDHPGAPFFASAVCARIRPDLFPHVGAAVESRLFPPSGDTRFGPLVQVAAWLMSHPHVQVVFENLRLRLHVRRLPDELSWLRALATALQAAVRLESGAQPSTAAGSGAT